MGIGGTLVLMVLMGTGMRKICPHGDGDGESSPDREFPVAISRGGSQHHKMNKDKKAMTQCESYMHCWTILFI